MARKGSKDRGLFQRGGNWWIRWTCLYGHEYREKVGPKSAAREFYQQRKVATKTEGFCLTEEREKQRREQSLAFSEVAERYLEWARENRPRSLQHRVSGLIQLTRAFGSRPLNRITRADIEAYQKKRQQDGVKPATINRDRAVLSHLYQKAEDWGLSETNPARGMESLPEANESPRPLTREEEARLLAVLPEDYLPFVTLALNTGLRMGELRTQLWADVDLPSGTLKVTRPKSKRHEVIPLNATAFALLVGLKQDGPLVFPGMPKRLSDTFIRYCRKAGLDDVSFHDLRDTFISRLAPHCNVPTLMRLARHRNYRTTQRYLKLDDQHLRDIVEQIVLDPQPDPLTGTATGTDLFESP